MLDPLAVQKKKRSVERSPPVAMEVKILAIEALESGLSADEVGELIGVGSSTLHKWRRDYSEEGVQGLCRKASSIATRKQCSLLQEKIVACRRAALTGSSRCRSSACPLPF